MPLLQKEWITRDFIQANPDCLFIFGDNLIRKGYGGQAREMRDEPNAVGVCTKRAPCMYDSCFWTDDDYTRASAIINDDLARVRKHLRKGGVVYIPTAGIGTDRAKMAERCPKLFKYLNRQLKLLEEIGKE